MSNINVLKYLSNTLLSDDYVGLLSFVTIVYSWTVIGGLLINITTFEILTLIVPLGFVTSIVGTTYIVRTTRKCRKEIRKGITSEINETRVEGEETSFEVEHIEDKTFTVRLVGENEAVRFIILNKKDDIENRMVANKI